MICLRRFLLQKGNMRSSLLGLKNLYTLKYSHVNVSKVGISWVEELFKEILNSIC